MGAVVFTISTALKSDYNGSPRVINVNRNAACQKAIDELKKSELLCNHYE